MSLSRRMAYKVVFLVLSLAVLGAVSVWGLTLVRNAMTVASDEYLELRLIQEIDRHVSIAGGYLKAGKSNDLAMLHELRTAVTKLDQFIGVRVRQETEDADHQHQKEQGAAFARDRLVALHSRLRSGALSLRQGLSAVASAHAVDEVLTVLQRLAAPMDATIAETHQAAAKSLRTTLIVLGAVSIAIIVVVISLSVAQYRSVVLPLRRLRTGVRKLAAKNFSERLEFSGDREFAELSSEFNRMAAALDKLYCELEDKVRAKSKELVRSERLASVGFLAAGVAHEINNPLNIISAYAELTLKRVQQELGRPTSNSDTTEALRIIRDEAFRCKEIIEKLLTLTRSGQRDRQQISLAHTTDEVVSMVSRLEQYRSRKISVRIDGKDDLSVRGNETELKQVLLNLLTNALNSMAGEPGEVRIEGSRKDGWITLSVEDSGCGMTPETLEHVFEPFYTSDHGQDSQNTGLGLSIVYAIVQAHKGRITAQSNGPGRGSRFVMQLPESRPEELNARQAG